MQLNLCIFIYAYLAKHWGEIGYFYFFDQIFCMDEKLIEQTKS